MSRHNLGGMPTHSDLQNLGRELRAARLRMGKASLTKFAAEIGVSRQHLSHIENAYKHPRRGPVIPSDDVLVKIAEGYDLPVSRLHALLGRQPDEAVPTFRHPEALHLAERFDRLPAAAQSAVLSMVGALEAAYGV